MLNGLYWNRYSKLNMCIIYFIRMDCAVIPFCSIYLKIYLKQLYSSAHFLGQHFKYQSTLSNNQLLLNLYILLLTKRPFNAEWGVVYAINNLYCILL